MIDRDLLLALAAEANLAPSVHNVQPTRFRLDDDVVELVLAPNRSLPVADASGHDVMLSAGAALEGLVMALGAWGLRGSVDTSPSPGVVARVRVTAGGEVDPLRAAVPKRASWRGRYLPELPGLGERLDLHKRDDVTLVRCREQVRAIARAADAAGLSFLRETPHRAELLHWLRLSPGHPDFARDGLSAPAMAMGRVEAFGAGFVLGRGFKLLDLTGLAHTLTSDSHAPNASAFVLFHRPAGENPVETGRAFYRRWLELDALGLAICPVSVLADLPAANAALRREHGVPDGRRLVSVWKAGIPDRRTIHRSRLPAAELVLDRVA